MRAWVVSCSKNAWQRMVRESAAVIEPFARIGNRCVFLHGFAKSDKANITLEEQKALRFAGKVFLDLSPLALCRALQAGVLMEVCCEQQTD